MNISTPLSYTSKERGILTDDEYKIVNDVFPPIWLILSFFGIITNSINVRTFISMGLEDGVTVSFLSLSLTDLCFSIASFIVGASSAFTAIEVKFDVIFPIQPFTVTVFAINAGIITCLVTGMATIFLALARCICVARPLHFKNVFTRSRSIRIHIAFCVVAVVCYVPILSQMGTQSQFDQSVNETRTVLWISDIREKVKDMTLLVVDVIMSFIVQTVLIICIVIMTICLHRSRQFRNSSKSDYGETKNTTAFRLSGKELQVVKQVVLISIIYIVCVTPKMFISIYSLTEPQFDIGKRLNNIYFTINFLRTALELINAASTFPVYLVFNTKFRSLCCPCLKRQ